MKPTLLLIDLQKDYLQAAGLQPAAERIVERAATLLAACRHRDIPVIHIQTSVRRDGDNRMPHWKAAGRWQCEEGTPGHEPPPALKPMAGERIVSKQYFSGFGSGELDLILKSSGCDALVLAGVHSHACVRATALDAYELGYNVWIADDAVGSDDALHAAITRRYLAPRSASFMPVSRIIQTLEKTASAARSETADDGALKIYSPMDSRRVIGSVSVTSADKVGHATVAIRKTQATWRLHDLGRRADTLRRLASLLTDEAEGLAKQITTEIGKPITMARAEVRRSVALLHAVAEHAVAPAMPGGANRTQVQHQPLGVVAIVTPWNNPLAIPVGKIAPALVYGNTVAWKPSPPATMIAHRLAELGRAAGWQEAGDDLVAIVTGDSSTAAALAENEHVDGVSLSGSLAAGYAMQEICVRRHIPFQGELGGNNAAIVWDDTDISHATREIAAGAFGFAGQRCTANRRVIVADGCFSQFVEELREAVGALAWGDPFDEATVIGPLIDVAKRDQIAQLLDRAAAADAKVFIPHQDQANRAELMKVGAYHPPAIVTTSDPASEMVQEESFGPMLVVQRSANFDAALNLANQVRQGLVASLFSDSPARREQFLAEAQAGILKFNTSTVDADATSPFGGWKASGVGPAEHGACDREFFSRVQTIYGS